MTTTFEPIENIAAVSHAVISKARYPAVMADCSGSVRYYGPNREYGVSKYPDRDSDGTEGKHKE